MGRDGQAFLRMCRRSRHAFFIVLWLYGAGPLADSAQAPPHFLHFFESSGGPACVLPTHLPHRSGVQPPPQPVFLETHMNRHPTALTALTLTAALALGALSLIHI